MIATLTRASTRWYPAWNWPRTMEGCAMSRDPSRNPAGFIRGEVQQNSIPYSGVGVGTIKKSATGRGNAGKPEMIAAMRRLGHLPDDDNEADALALLYCVMHSTDSKGMHDAA
jgi:hypothetical protein